MARAAPAPAVARQSYQQEALSAYAFRAATASRQFAWRRYSYTSADEYRCRNRCLAQPVWRRKSAPLRHPRKRGSCCLRYRHRAVCPTIVVAALPDAPWLVKHNPPALERSLLRQVWWRCHHLPNEARARGCGLLLNTDAGSVCPSQPAVAISQDMLSLPAGRNAALRFFESAPATDPAALHSGQHAQAGGTPQSF